MKRVYIAGDDVEAHVVKAMLDDAGIPAVVQGERLEPLAGRGAANAFPEVWVRDDESPDQIAAILADYERKRAAVSSTDAETTPGRGEPATGESEEGWKSAEPEPIKPSGLSASGRRKLLWLAIAAVVAAFALALRPPHPKSQSSLYDAVRAGDVGAVQRYLDTGIDANLRDQDGWTLLHYAATSNQLAVSKTLLDHGADVNAKGRGGVTALHNAAWRGYVDIAEFLLARGADINAFEDAGLAPLHFAAEKGHVAVIELLLRHGTGIDARSKRNGTPLHCAAYSGRAETVEFLATHGADVNASGARRWTALHYAADRGHTLVAEVLIRKGAHIDVAAENGCTPLHVAANVGNAEVVALLLAEGANVNALGADIVAQQPEGKTPLDIALSKRFTTIADLLREHGSRSGNEVRDPSAQH